MTLDQLDRAFQVGLIQANTLVRENGTAEWQTLGAIAGLDDEEPATVEPATVQGPGARADAHDDPPLHDPAQRSSVLPTPADEDPNRETLAGLGGFRNIAPMGQPPPPMGSQPPPALPAGAFPPRAATLPMGAPVVVSQSKTPGRIAPAQVQPITAGPAPALKQSVGSRPPPLPVDAFGPVAAVRAPAVEPAVPQAAPGTGRVSGTALKATLPLGLASPFASAPPSPFGAAPAPSAAPALGSAPPPPRSTPPPLGAGPPAIGSRPPPPKTSSAPPLPTNAFQVAANPMPSVPSHAPPSAAMPVMQAPMGTRARARGSRAANTFLFLFALVTGLIVLHRNGILFDAAKSLGLQKAYLGLEQSVLGPPSVLTPRGVELIDPAPVDSSTGGPTAGGP